MSNHVASVISTYGGPLSVDLSFKRSWLGRKAILATDHLPSFRAGNMSGLVYPVDTLDDIRTVYTEISESQGQLVLADAAEQVLQVIQAGKFPIILCGCYKTVEEDMSKVAFMRKLGVRLFTYSSNRRNVLCDGCGERNPSGLSHLGVSVAHELERNGILPDVSHLSDESFWDLMENTTGPIVATHSNARALCNNSRNLTDDQIKAIAKRGGFIGTSTYPTLVADQNPTAELLARHMEYIGKLVGFEHVTIGTDLIDYLGTLFNATIHRIDPTSNLYNRQDDSQPTAGLAGYQDVQNLVGILAKRGLTSDQIELVAYKNFVRVLQSAEKGGL